MATDPIRPGQQGRAQATELGTQVRSLASDGLSGADVGAIAGRIAEGIELPEAERAAFYLSARRILDSLAHDQAIPSRARQRIADLEKALIRQYSSASALTKAFMDPSKSLDLTALEPDLSSVATGEQASLSVAALLDVLIRGENRWTADGWDHEKVLALNRAERGYFSSVVEQVLERLDATGVALVGKAAKEELERESDRLEQKDPDRARTQRLHVNQVREDLDAAFRHTGWDPVQGKMKRTGLPAPGTPSGRNAGERAAALFFANLEAAMSSSGFTRDFELLPTLNKQAADRRSQEGYLLDSEEQNELGQLLSDLLQGKPGRFDFLADDASILSLADRASFALEVDRALERAIGKARDLGDKPLDTIAARAASQAGDDKTAATVAMLILLKRRPTADETDVERLQELRQVLHERLDAGTIDNLGWSDGDSISNPAQGAQLVADYLALCLQADDRFDGPTEKSGWPVNAIERGRKMYDRVVDSFSGRERLEFARLLFTRLSEHGINPTSDENIGLVPTDWFPAAQVLGKPKAAAQWLVVGTLKTVNRPDYDPSKMNGAIGARFQNVYNAYDEAGREVIDAEIEKAIERQPEKLRLLLSRHAS